MEVEIRGMVDGDEGEVYERLEGGEVITMVIDRGEQENRINGAMFGEFDAMDLADIIDTLRDLFGEELFTEAIDEVANRIDSSESRDDMTQTYNRVDAAYVQEEYCREHKLPLFAPKDGQCWCCGNNIYGISLDGSVRGYSVQYAGSNHITHCPFCNMSYDE